MSPKIFSSKKNIIIISIIAAILIIGGTIAAITLSNGISVSVGVADMLQLADRYLTEMNYEQAIVEFQKILEIDPKNVDAYIGLADAYIAVGEKEKAMEILNQAKNNIENEQRIENKLAEVNSISETTQDTAESSTQSANTTTTAAAATTTTTPPQTTTTRAETTTAEPVTQTTTTEATTADSQTTASTTAPVNLSADVAICGGREYPADMIFFSGNLQDPNELVDLTFGNLFYDSFYAFCDNIGYPEFKKLYQDAEGLYKSIKGIGISGNYNYGTLSLSSSGWPYYEATKYSDESFFSLCYNTFTDDVAKSFIQDEEFLFYKGQLWSRHDEVGGDISKVYEDFELIKKTDTLVEIKRITYHDDTYSMTYEPSKREQYRKEYFTNEFVLTDGGWRIKQYNYKPQTDFVIAGKVYSITTTTEIHIMDTHLSNEDIENIGKMTNLTNLTLQKCGVTDISFLSNLTNLTRLCLNNNEISDISPLGNLTKLTDLELGSNKIMDITSLANLVDLETLDLYYNMIIDITPLSNLHKIWYLDLIYNQISDIEPLFNLTNLEHLFLSSGNIISDSDIERLKSKLPNCDDI